MKGHLWATSRDTTTNFQPVSGHSIQSWVHRICPKDSHQYTPERLQQTKIYNVHSVHAKTLFASRRHQIVYTIPQGEPESSQQVVNPIHLLSGFTRLLSSVLSFLALDDPWLITTSRSRNLGKLKCRSRKILIWMLCLYTVYGVCPLTLLLAWRCH